ncbi:hypothetical protein M422DRAFT_277176 [Sphaerobolus stellatus SS14]|uniref:Uncharacterized protein n=1 Tax=Sphaerobolus stellatus (strain SS14) TaxID=990650 RepID=A0A0C9TKQ7_SPHS4|nr:hypothetical protein M422DRAFT_277176 [Sphaerobolus stellatus SS14]
MNFGTQYMPKKSKAYVKGLNGTQAAWAAQKYRGHRFLPANILKESEEAQNKAP